MKRALATGLSLLAVVALVTLAHAGEDPARGIVTATGTGVSAGCADTVEERVAFQCVGCRVRYRLLTAAQYVAGDIVPTDGGALLDGGVWGPLVDFTANPDPYKALPRSGQTKICFFAEDAGVGPDGGYGSFSSRIEVFGSY
jgi:hypothetical protein